MKKLLIIALFMGGCNGVAPLTITSVRKTSNANHKGKCAYGINGDYLFYENCGKYNIGDTIK